MTSTPRYRHLLLAVLALAIAASTLMQSEAQAARPNPKPPATPAVQFGFNEWPATANFPLQRQLNAPVERIFMGWNRVQVGGPSSWDWRLTDGQYQAIVNAGLKPLIVVVGAPCWAHPSTPCVGLDPAWTPPDPAYDSAWGEFNRRLASRYPKAAAIEVWNEQNIVPAWGSTPDPARYTQLLKTAYTSIKSASIKGARSANIPVISGGLFAASATGSYGVADSEFLQGMYDAGANGYLDGIGVHTYLYSTGVDGLTKTYDPVAIQSPLSRARAVRDAAGAGSTPLWITESGESTASQDGYPAGATESQQASDLVATVRSVKAMSDVRALVIHRLIDQPLDSSSPFGAIESGFGVYRLDGTPKASACALSSELGGSLFC